ncbi:glycine zipper 2TM domain-containing protein [Microbulbifer sediminum]|uniref:glycine zipper 2TM domain-containing protein n=1 Tax=Microbulbifer sediminum TaxID=2904250 RepID=UPI001F01FAF5|nr:glycine zipper 2TM domain-containing protein [Microbulbifer sediminum]
MLLNKNFLFAVLVVALVGFSVTASAGGSGYYGDRGEYDFARVTDVIPVYNDIQVVEPRTQCWDEQVAYPGRGSAASTLIGGLIGAAVGNKAGHHRRGRNARTLAGAAIGATIGHSISSRKNAQYVTEQRCQRVDEYVTRRELVGYDVRYRYNGREYMTRTDRHPGDRIRVRVDVAPAW